MNNNDFNFEVSLITYGVVLIILVLTLIGLFTSVKWFWSLFA